MPDLAEDVSDGAASSTAALSAAARAVCFSPPTAPAGPLRVEPQRAPSGSLTEEEFSTIAKLRELLEVSWSSWTDGGKAEAAAHSDDFTLLRFIKARPDDVSKALEMFKESMEWRHTRGINQLFAELHPCAPQSSRHDAVRKYYFGGAGGMTLEGGAYFVLRVGQADLGGISREPKVVSLMMDADAINMETIFRCVRACSAATGKFERVHVVVDVAGFSLATLRHVGMVKDIMKVGPNMFPEGAAKVFLVNVPAIFAGAWTLISPWLPKRSRDKVSMYSSWSTPAALATIIDTAQLPSFLGGEQPEDQTIVARAETVPTSVEL